MPRKRTVPRQPGQRPSQVFAQRLKDTRSARGLSQAELAEMMTAAGRPMNKLAVLRVESGERKVSLDEALAFAHVLNAVPTHLLAPPDDELVWLTNEFGVDGAGMRDWLRFGIASFAHAGELPAERIEDLRLRGIAVLARAYLDAAAGKDKAGLEEAVIALHRIFTTPGKTPAELGIGGGITFTTAKEQS